MLFGGKHEKVGEKKWGIYEIGEEAEGPYMV
jgi:hypothetical protein